MAGHPPRASKGVHMRAHPVQQLLGTNRVGVEEAAGPEHGYEQLGLEGQLAGLGS